jgi:hypothetical protein
VLQRPVFARVVVENQSRSLTAFTTCSTSSMSTCRVPMWAAEFRTVTPFEARRGSTWRAERELRRRSRAGVEASTRSAFGPVAAMVRSQQATRHPGRAATRAASGPEGQQRLRPHDPCCRAKPIRRPRTCRRATGDGRCMLLMGHRDRQLLAGVRLPSVRRVRRSVRHAAD